MRTGRAASVAVTHPFLQHGGSEAGVLWALEALKHDFAVTLITGGPVNLERLNESYGTTLGREEIRVERVPMPWLARAGHFAALRGALVQRHCHSRAKDFDLLISGYGPCSFGVPAIQYIQDFAFAPALQRRLHPELEGYRRWWYGDSPVRMAYLGLCRAIYSADPEGWKSNLTVANSRWTADLLKKEFAMQARVIYPPVAGEFPGIPWERKEDGFVCVGRVVPEKRMDAVMRILARVREQGHGVHLHILGGVDDSPYGRKIKRLAEKHRKWVLLEGWVAGRRKAELIAGHRYGINGRQNEPFGIAAAEMVKAGCIVFVPDSGGQKEIVDHPALTFRDDDEAVEKIAAVLRNAELQEKLRNHLARQAQMFSAERFQQQIRDVVWQALSGVGMHAHA
jgi:glycosyltransferase involved in cell wall biosynthesis